MIGEKANIKHFSLLIYDNLAEKNKDNDIQKENDKNKIFDKLKNKENKLLNRFIFSESFHNYDESLCTFKLVSKKNNPNYYQDIYNYLLSKEKETDINTNKIDWNKVTYPSNKYNKESGP